MTQEHDYYAVLGVPPDASAEQIRIARRKRLRETHPDVNPDDPKAGERFDFICKVCEVLGNPERRRMYDQELRGTTDRSSGDRVRCRSCGGSGAWRFLKCGVCRGLGRSRMGFASECTECGGSGRVPDPCFRCDGRGWNPKPHRTEPRSGRASHPKSKSSREPGAGNAPGASHTQDAKAGPAGAETKAGARDPGNTSRRAPARNHYEVLGIPVDASAARISAHYRRLAETGNITDEVKSAYRRIGDPRRRGGYDRRLGISPSKGSTAEVDVHVSRRVLLEGAEQYEFTVHDHDLCPSCQGAGRIIRPCRVCDGKGYWQYGSAVPAKCDACRGRGSDDQNCAGCLNSGWVPVTRKVRGRVPAASDERTPITVQDDLLGVVTLRLRLALVPGFARKE